MNNPFNFKHVYKSRSSASTFFVCWDSGKYTNWHMHTATYIIMAPKLVTFFESKHHELATWYSPQLRERKESINSLQKMYNEYVMQQATTWKLVLDLSYFSQQDKSNFTQLNWDYSEPFLKSVKNWGWQLYTVHINSSILPYAYKLVLVSTIMFLPISTQLISLSFQLPFACERISWLHKIELICCMLVKQKFGSFHKNSFLDSTNLLKQLTKQFFKFLHFYCKY